MIIETIQIISNGLAHATYGVNAQLANVPLNGDDTQPDAITVRDETRSAPLAMGRDGAEYPAILVCLDSGGEYNGEAMQSQRYGEISISIDYVNEDFDALTSRLHCFYTLRAVQKALRSLLSNPNAADCQTGGVQVLSCLTLTHTDPKVNQDGTVATSGGLRGVFKVCDTNP